ncbi:Prefoldin subunit 6 [Balamuthia mandrillaris]
MTLEKEVKELRELQNDIAKKQNTQAQLTAQLKENELVKQELELVEDESNIYKLIGPVLVKQDKQEAVANVGKRIDFIQNELKRLNEFMEKQVKAQAEKRKVVLDLQAKLQQQQAS